MSALIQLNKRIRSGVALAMALPRWEILFYLAFICYLLWQGLSRTTFESFLFIPMQTAKLLFQGAFVVLLAASFLLQARPIGDTVLFVVLAAIFLVSALTCGDRDLLLAFLVVAVGRDASVRKVAAIVFVFYLLLLIVTMTSAAFGLVDVRYAALTDGRAGRHSWGFTHPNTLAATALLICMAWFYVRFPRIALCDMAVWLPALIISNFVAQSRTSTSVLILLIVLTHLFQRLQGCGMDRIMGAIALVVGLILILVSIYFMASYDSSVEWQVKLNSVLTGRLGFAHDYFEQYPPHLFGTSFSEAPIRLEELGYSSRLVVDNSYARLIILYGYIPAIIWFVAFIMLCAKRILNRNIDYLFLCFFIMIVFGFAESATLSITSNFTLVAYSELLNRSRREEHALPGTTRSGGCI